VTPTPGATAFWPTVRLLLRFAHLRSRGRAERQRRLLGNRGDSGLGPAAGSMLLTIIAMGIHALAALALSNALELSPRVTAEVAGRRVVPAGCVRILAEETASHERVDVDRVRRYCREDPRFGSQEEPAAQATALVDHYRVRGPDGFVEGAGASPWAQTGAAMDPVASVVGSTVLVLWFVMLAFQGEGTDLDLQRRRHPMWEWLLSHPVDSRAVFLAEMLSPLAANAFVLTAPVFWIGVYWAAYDDFPLAVAIGILVGVPVSVAAGCLGKTIEIMALLRLAPRSRGAALGMLSWLGSTSYLLTVLVAFSPQVILAVARVLAPLAALGRWPLLAWACGLHGTPAASKGVAACWTAVALLIAACVHMAARATRRGLAGGFGDRPDAPVALSEAAPAWLRREPLYRKELLWLWRDRGALIQVFLIPLSIAGLQLFNFRHMLADATGGWHLMSGAAVVLGSYFLWVLGPRSLMSEGSALWIPLTWPRGLEDLLRTKARLWWMAAGVVVTPLLVITATRFPADAWKVALVALGWAAFSRTLSDKSVTLVGTPLASGEMEPVPKGRVWAASLGMVTFAVGILSQQWSVAFVGVVYSWMTSAALWQNFRARLPFLFDPWSEKLPRPPTLMHAMVSISVMVEGGAVLFGLAIVILGREGSGAARAVAYGLSAVVTCLAASAWLDGRGVPVGALWRWSDPLAATRATLGLATGVALGVALGVFGAGYGWAVEQLPEWGDALRAARQSLLADPSARVWLFVMAVGIAPLAEEFLFRGLLFRALDREWGGAKAVWGSACFFAIYHPPLAWIPVAIVGAVCAVLFRRSGHLLPSVLLHMSYNAVVVWTA
jgi:membrane protease YdiL (CAAX protease family)